MKTYLVNLRLNTVKYMSASHQQFSAMLSGDDSSYIKYVRIANKALKHEIIKMAEADENVIQRHELARQ